MCKLCNTEYTKSERLFKCTPCLDTFHFRCMCKRAIGGGDVTCPTCKSPLSAKEVEKLKNSNSGDIELMKKDVKSIYSVLESMQRSIAAIEKTILL